MEDATLNTPSRIHNSSPRHPFSVTSRSDRVALQTEGLSLADSHTRPATERTPESDYGDRFARTHEFRPAI